MRTALLALAAFALAQPLRAQQLPVKGYGQELVDQVTAKERGLLVVVMHVSPPGVATYPIIASNIGRIGKVADDDDMRVITTGNTNLEVAHGGSRFEVEMPMHDLAGNTIGALGIVFPYRRGASKAALEKRAVSIRDWLARRIREAGSLVEPYPFESLATTRTYAQKLIDAGVSLQRIRKAVKFLRQHMSTEPTGITLLSDGASVYACESEDEVIDLVRRGQGVFAIALDAVWKDLSGSLGQPARTKQLKSASKVQTSRAPRAMTRAGGA